jgi:alkylation response protein AidB-like acyl-CoA dehydrogenase
MDATFSAEQDELRHAVRAVATDHCGSAQLRAVIDAGNGMDAALWSLLARDLGLAGIAVPAEYGGSGGSVVDAAVVLEEAGRALLPVPLLGTLIAAVVIGRGDQAVAADVLPDLAAGLASACLVVAPHVTVTGDRLTGAAAHVLDAVDARLLVVAAGDGLWVCRREAAGVSMSAGPALDLTRWQASASFDGAAAMPLGDAVASAAAVDLLRVGLALEAVGVARRCLELTTAYLKTREQFGRPIGSFQALQHRAADLVVAVESAASTAYYAAWSAQESPGELPVVAPLALAVCGEAAYLVAAETIQLHGGIGFTWEHDAHLYFKRATTIRLLLGDSHRQRALVADRLSLGQGRAAAGQCLGTLGPVTPQ